MNKLQFKLNKSAVRELLKSGQMKTILDEKATGIADAAGTGYEHRGHLSDQRYIVNVYADTPEAKRDNLKNNTLLKAVR